MREAHGKTVSICFSKTRLSVNFRQDPLVHELLNPDFDENNMRLCIAVTVALVGLFSAVNMSTAAPLSDQQNAWLRKAERHEKAGWIYLHIEGAPGERGFQHGYLLGPEIKEALRVTR